MKAQSPPPPKITVIVAVFNGAQTLQRCLDSILGQSWECKELIVMDGGSSDGSREILQRQGSAIAYWESQPDRGIYHAWNKALVRATGDWICFLGADDYFWSPDVLERMAAHLAAQPPAVRLVYGQVAIVSTTGALVRYDGRPWEEARASFQSVMSIPHPGLLHQRSLFAERGFFDESFRITADYDLLLRELPTHPAVFIPGIVTVGFQRGGVSYSPAAMPQMLRELARVRRKHGLPAPNFLHMTMVERKMRITALLGRVLGGKAAQRLIQAVHHLTGRQD